MPETHFDEWIAPRYADLWPELFEPAVLDPAVAFLAGLAGLAGSAGSAGSADAGPVLELGIGTGRIAIPLSRRGLRVHGIELSPAMAGELRAGDADVDVEVTVGDFARVAVGEAEFSLVYLVRNTITNLTTQDEQVDAFRNAARHLVPGGCFVVENYVPELRRLPPGETRHVFMATPTHVAFEEYDVAAQIAHSHHHWVIDGELRSFSSPHRYAWPAELDLMARIAGMRLRERWADWHREPFTGESRAHISVWQKPPNP